MNVNNQNITRISIEIYPTPKEDKYKSGWCWKVCHNGNLYADEIEPELSRITAESNALKYVSELLGGGNDPR